MRYLKNIRQVMPEKGASHIVTTGERSRQRPSAKLMPLWQFAFCCFWSYRELIAINTTAYRNRTNNDRRLDPPPHRSGIVYGH